ncbi:MAG: phosphate/phosphite/phosphonate ABC transporter substrate-binding protein [Candidatus Thiodiazotropha sp. (ex Semelilucina semeliformis)]|nr:phosphate/phosphite/phosphonate ABC transporter substrate-binding protein [Candidatus Thiodiazotropha sp. (ex Semelilucina semeliformis)]
MTILAGGSIESLYDTSVTDAEIVFTLVFNEVIKKSNERFKLKIVETDQELAIDLISGELDAIFTNTLHYLKLEEHLNPSACYVVQHGPELKSHYYLLVRRDSGIKHLSQLQNKKISIPYGHAVGQRFLDVELLKEDLPTTEKFFSEIRKTTESNSSVVNLFFSKVDAALITDFSFKVANELNPQIEKELSVIGISDPLVYQIISLRHDFSQSRIDKIEPHVLNINKSPRLVELFRTFRMNSLQKADSETLKEVRSLNQEYLELVTTGNKQ